MRANCHMSVNMTAVALASGGRVNWTNIKLSTVTTGRTAVTSAACHINYSEISTNM